MRDANPHVASLMAGYEALPPGVARMSAATSGDLPPPAPGILLLRRSRLQRGGNPACRMTKRRIGGTTIINIGTTTI
jgi:hypothetical protein